MHSRLFTGSTAPGIAVLLGFLLLPLLPLLLLGGVAEAAPRMVLNERFEDGTRGWKSARTSTVISSAPGGVSASKALKVTRRARGVATVVPARRLSDDGAVNTVYTWSGSFRSNRAGVKGVLAVRELVGRTVVEERKVVTALPVNRWTSLKLTMARTKPGSRFALRVGSPSRRARGVLLVDNVRSTAAAPAAAAAPADTSGPRLSNGCSSSRRGIPACGAYLGSAYGANSDASSMESMVGSRLGVRRTYFTGAKVDAGVRTVAADLAAGRLPWISFKLPHSWEEMAAGKGDAWALGLARRLAALEGPVWIAFHHEPEGDGAIQAWRRMQERLAPIIRTNAPNVAFTVILTGWHQLYGDAEYSLDAIWPRVKVDVAGFDVYNSRGVVKNGVVDTTDTDLKASYFRPISAWAKAQGVAWGIAETGFTDAAARAHPHWIRDTYVALQGLGGVAFTYFNSGLNSAANWTLSTEVKRDSYREAAVGSPLLPRG